MNSKTAMRASLWVLKRRRSSSSDSRVAKKLSHIALSKQSPTEPIEGRTPASRQRWPKAIEVVLATLVRVMNHGGGPALPQRQVERLQHQFGAQMGFHRPTDDSAAESVEHYRQVKKPGPGRDVSYVGDPQPIGRRGNEVAFDQVGCRPRAALSHRGSYPFAATHSPKAGGLHQARDPLASEMDASR